jgi:phenylalanyl-tRNA synthetase beta chain
MNIQILDSWLREHLKTRATPANFAEKLSLTSVSVERIEKLGNDFLYDIEVTTNRPDLMSVIGIAREAAAVLPQHGIDAEFIPLKLAEPKLSNTDAPPLEIVNDETLTGRICAVIMDVEIGKSPKEIEERLLAADIRSINNVIDVTNYVMREVGHPTHVFDYDRIASHKLIVRESKKGEKIVTLDKKEHILLGGDIVADDGTGQIVDLLGVMGTDNSVVTDTTKRILYFIDNNNPEKIRRTSMNLGIRSEAAVLNEKGVDPELAYEAFLRGIDLFEKVAQGKVVSKLYDIYPNKPKEKTISVLQEKITSVIGIEIPLSKAAKTLKDLGFETKIDGHALHATVPTFRLDDVSIEEDLIEEIARVYGYHLLPSILPPIQNSSPYNLSSNIFFWEARIRNFFKYNSFSEVYTYTMVGDDLFEGDITDAVIIANPLNDELLYMRRTLVPSLLQIADLNKSRDELFIFEIANVYIKKTNDLPNELLKLAGLIRYPKVSFAKSKGLLENLFSDLGIKNISWKNPQDGGEGADIFAGSELLGTIEQLSNDTIDFELDFEILIKHSSLKKTYNQISRFPPVIEDVRIALPAEASFDEAVKVIKKQSHLVATVNLLDAYQNKITLRITYQDSTKNLTNEDIAPIREKIETALTKDLKAKIG